MNQKGNAVQWNDSVVQTQEIEVEVSDYLFFVNPVSTVYQRTNKNTVEINKKEDGENK